MVVDEYGPKAQAAFKEQLKKATTQEENIVNVKHEQRQLDKTTIFHKGPDGYSITNKSPYPVPTV